MISVLILTKNEEQDLPGCLASVAWSDDVHVFDSFSADRTVEIARQAGVRVTQRPFDDYATHRNAAQALPMLRHEWVLFLDADERMTDALRAEMSAAVRSADADVDAFRFRRRDYFLGRWLKHAQISPYFIRLFRRGRASYRRAVNEIADVCGRVQDLREHFDHFPFSKGLAHWVEKHNRYSTMEAQCALASRRGATAFSPARAFFAHDFNERRFHQKELFYRLPGRPLVKFLYMLVVRRAFLDGRAGICYAVLQSIYEYFIVLKTAELQAAATPATPQPSPPAAASAVVAANQ